MFLHNRSSYLIFRGRVVEMPGLFSIIWLLAKFAALAWLAAYFLPELKWPSFVSKEQSTLVVDEELDEEAIDEEPEFEELGFFSAEKLPAPTAQTTEQYIKLYAKFAQANMRRTGVPASIQLAQGILESNSSKSRIARLCNNHFGIKCHDGKRGRCSKWHCKQLPDRDDPKAYFRCFKSAPAGFSYHAELLSSDYYAELKRYKPPYKYHYVGHGKDERRRAAERKDGVIQKVMPYYACWAHGLRARGYATSRNYGKNLVNTIEKNNLTRFDK